MLIESIIEHEYFSWALIFLCLSQSAMFSGLNLALFGISRLELEIEAESGNCRAKRILGLRPDANSC